MDSITLDKKLKKGVITDKDCSLIEEYNFRLHENNVPVIYNLRHLRKTFQIRKSEQEFYFGDQQNVLYATFFINKKNGSKRKIEAPIDKLKAIQTWIKENILEKLKISSHATGFTKGSNIYKNAIPHLDKECVINIDIKDFFPTIKYYDVFKIFVYIGYNHQVSHLLTKLCTKDNQLPQGAPTSPIISNIICKKLDKRLSQLAKYHDCNYTRYADDITVSGKANLVKIIPLIKEIISEEKLNVNEEKFRIQKNYQRQEVTGLTVNKKISVSKLLKKEIENAVYYCKKFGVISHMQRINCNHSFYKEHVYGIAYFIKMINEDQGNKYLTELNNIDWIY